MPVGCSIIKNTKGDIEYVESPYNGEKSNLYESALEYTQDSIQAKDVWLVASTPMFKQDVYEPKTNTYKSNLNRKLENFSNTDLPVTVNEYAGGELVITAIENKKLLGQVRLTPYKSGYRITMSQIGGVRGQGTGSALYKQVIKEIVLKDKPLYSDVILSESAEGVWRKMQHLGIAQKIDEGYVVNSTPFDENQEPSLEEVLEYIDILNNQERLSGQEKNDLKIALSSTSIKDSDELYNVLKEAFYPSPTAQSLRKTGLYNEAEINNILVDSTLQQEIKDILNKLKTTDTIYNEIPVDEDYISSSMIGVNIIGKNVTDNPYKNEKEALELLGGVKNEVEYEDALEDSDLQYLKDQPSKYNIYSDYNRVPEMFINEQGELEQKMSKTKELLEETIKTPENTALEDNIAYLRALPVSVWDNNPSEVKQLLKQIREDASDIALDLQGLEDSYDNKTRNEVISFLDTIDLFIAQQDDVSLDTLASSLDEYFSQDTSLKEKVVKVQPQSRDRNLIHLETELKAPELFQRFGLLPLGNNIYQKVRNSDDLAVMYENLYQNILVNPQILPTEAYASALDQEGSLDRSKLRNKQQTIQDIVNFVQGQTKKIGKGDNVMMQRMYISAAYFNTKLRNEKPIPSLSGEVNSIMNPVSNIEYLQTEFISDFREKQIKEKQKDSEAYKKYYSNFNISNQGIEMINTDPISLLEMEPYIEDNMKDYMRLKKSFIGESDTYEGVITDNMKRSYYSNFPESLPVFEGNYQIVSNRTVATRENESFIKIDNKVYELIETLGEYNFYSQLDTNPSLYKEYSPDTTKPELDVDISNYSYSVSEQVDEMDISSFYTQEESEDIDSEIEC